MAVVIPLHRALLGLVVALGLVWAAPTSAAAAASDGRPPDGRPPEVRESVQRAGPASYQKAIVEHTNRRRVAHDRPRLRVHKCVTRAARKQARRMAAQERMFHQNLSAVLRRCDLSRVGENVAYGYPTGKAAVKAWMRSPGHRRNILDRRFRLIGAGAAQSDGGVWYAAQVFGRR